MRLQCHHKVNRHIQYCVRMGPCIAVLIPPNMSYATTPRQRPIKSCATSLRIAMLLPIRDWTCMLLTSRAVHGVANPIDRASSNNGNYDVFSHSLSSTDVSWCQLHVQQVLNHLYLIVYGVHKEKIKITDCFILC